MAYLWKLVKSELVILANELELDVNENNTVPEIRNKIVTQDNYDESITKEIVNRILEEKREKSELQLLREKVLSLENNDKDISYLGKLVKADLIVLADELGILVSDTEPVSEIRKKIISDENYNEGLTKEIVSRMLEEKKEMQELQILKAKNQELELYKLTFQSNDKETRSSVNSSNVNISLMRLSQPFDPHKDEIFLYLKNFETKAKLANIPETEYVVYLLNMLPHDIVNQLTREPGELAHDYSHIKTLLLKRYKLNPEQLKFKFFSTHKKSQDSWRDFCNEISAYFNDWLAELKIESFEELKELIIANQIKTRVPNEVKQHFLDTWNSMNSSLNLAEKLDEFESLRIGINKQTGTKPKQFSPTLQRRATNNAPQVKRNFSNNYQSGPGQFRYQTDQQHYMGRNYNYPYRAGFNQYSNQSKYNSNEMKRSTEKTHHGTVSDKSSRNKYDKKSENYNDKSSQNKCNKNVGNGVENGINDQ